MTPARERWIAVGLCALGAGVVLLAVTQRWVRAVVADPGFPRVVVDASGRALAPAAAGLALVALAGAVALLVTRRIGRVVTGVVLVLAGVGIVAAAVTTASDLEGAVASKLADAVGRTGADPTSLSGSPWPWLVVAGGVMVACGGLLAVVRGTRWPGPSQRYETAASTPAGDAGATAPSDVSDAMWKALDRGEDPTDEP